ncbi:RNA polymerase II accessory factor cdc73 family protein [Rhodocollybia butyracea]|uniref:RNA polymerase II accessory factor cdc73 family protein n=1 Tax=Rhodocollybia butyracea TaxID=206335 RepID=A0A9P5Q3I0_9AGAR|nr:RNA polymerase II accessory factor cdc73 family protein [Rhodocollybia butyracea]
MSTSTDSLLAFRQAIQSQNEPILLSSPLTSTPADSLSQATHIHIPPTENFPKSTPTRWRKGSSSTSTSNITLNDLYTLEAIYLAYKLKSLPAPEYAKQAREAGLGIGMVSVTERKVVVDWLEGISESSERLVDSEKVSAAVKTAESSALGSTTPPSTPPPTVTHPHGSPSKSAPHGSPSSKAYANGGSPIKRKYIPDTTDVESVKKIRAQEIELWDRNSVLRGTKKNVRDFSSVRTQLGEKLKKIKESAGKAAPAPSSTVMPGMDSKMMSQKKRPNWPIIMISSSPTALITMYNVKKFLQESTFEPTESARGHAQTEGNLRPDDVVIIDRRLTHIEPSGKETIFQQRRVCPLNSPKLANASFFRYVIIDSQDALTKFGPDAWDRVVCVMTTGQAWQFRPYKWSEPKVLFHHVKGIYVSWANDPPNTKIKDWNVTELKIDQQRRHIDKSVVAHFWRILDDWMTANKPSLMKS